MEAPEYAPAPVFHASAPQFPLEKQPKAAATAAAAAADHFLVEDLLDFSNEDDDGDDVGFDAAPGNSANSSTVTAIDCISNSSVSGGSDPHFPADNGLSGELCVPDDELAELEWLSSVTEESFSSEDIQKLQLISGVKSSSSPSETHSSISDANATANAAAVGNDFGATPFIADNTHVRGARSKRSRAAPCNWASRLILLTPNTNTTTSDSELLFPPPSALPANLPGAVVKKAATKKEEGNWHDGERSSAMAPSPDGRKCLHCAIDKTPQWRTGPMGPKTLCNACGVRYKSGRLVPEYRPAASPTFVLSKHSNSHRKVMELRRQKELMIQQHHHLGGGGGGGAGQFMPAHHHHHLFEAAAAAGDDFLIHHHVGPDFRQLI